MTLSELYGAVEGHKKCDGNSHWKDKIRQTLYVNRFEKTADDHWRIAS